MLNMEMFVSTPVVETSKTHQLRKGNALVTAEGSSRDTCPVTI